MWKFQTAGHGVYRSSYQGPRTEPDTQQAPVESVQHRHSSTQWVLRETSACLSQRGHSYTSSNTLPKLQSLKVLLFIYSFIIIDNIYPFSLQKLFTVYQAQYWHVLAHLNLPHRPYEASIIVIRPMLHRWKLRHREAKWLAWGHWLGSGTGFEPEQSGSEPML